MIGALTPPLGARPTAMEWATKYSSLDPDEHGEAEVNKVHKALADVAMTRVLTTNYGEFQQALGRMFYQLMNKPFE